ncbi:hypothetical protein HZU40_23685 [Mycolicibacterium fluoranthenivorans]|uniref:Uncharacterized protein n=1 Tax=Mycolicibacterium fluoranthenivorans TaxID=258505 RepID=A0A7G8PA32_9MYCO|nr:hypothetical protein [Mycolicibacterium fluoranthenivorans]QNJ91198.1 hypothetical protein HZU40_23685 [Mycolicibacterium fluoranthenivorans]
MPSRKARAKVRVKKESPELGWRRITWLWAMALLTVLVFTPLFVPGLALYVSFISAELLAVTCAIIGVKYRRQATAIPGGED